MADTIDFHVVHDEDPEQIPGYRPETPPRLRGAIDVIRDRQRRREGVQKLIETIPQSVREAHHIADILYSLKDELNLGEEEVFGAAKTAGWDDVYMKILRNHYSDIIPGRQAHIRKDPGERIYNERPYIKTHEKVAAAGCAGLVLFGVIYAASVLFRGCAPEEPRPKAPVSRLEYSVGKF